MKTIHHWIQDTDVAPRSGTYFEKMNPATGEVMCSVARGGKEDAELAVDAAQQAFPAWSAMTPVARGNVLRKAAKLLSERKEEIGALLAAEGGQTLKQGTSEVDGVCEHIHFWAGEGRRLYGHTMPSKTDHRLVYTMREPVGIVLVITPANTPFGGRAVMPALIAGNTVVMKPSEDVPSAALALARALKDAGVPSGVFSVVQGLGAEAGAALVADERVNLISFTGSFVVGKSIEQAIAGRKGGFVKLSLELGGKNPMVVCDDADLESAVKSAALSAFSLAGQRCAAASRIIVMDGVYDAFRDKLIERTRALRVGLQDTDDLGPVVNERQLERILAAVERAKAAGATVLVGGEPLTGAGYGKGYFMAPTLLENVASGDAISHEELFGPVSVLYRATNYEDAVRIANDSSYGLTASIHTHSLHRAQDFAKRANVGVVHVNGHTYGSEPHMPFGGSGRSGNGTREAGLEALDVYTQWKTVTMTHDPKRVG